MSSTLDLILATAKSYSLFTYAPCIFSAYLYYQWHIFIYNIFLIVCLARCFSYLKTLQRVFAEEADRTGNTKLILSAAVPAGLEDIKAGYNIPEVCR